MNNEILLESFSNCRVVAVQNDEGNIVFFTVRKGEQLIRTFHFVTDALEFAEAYSNRLEKEDAS